MKRLSLSCVGVLILFLQMYAVHLAVADTFGSEENTFDIEFVTIGNPGNAADPDDGSQQAGLQNFGSVANTYRIGKFEVSEDMIDKANSETAGNPNPLNLTHTNRGPNKPTTDLSWFEAAQFVNWLNTSTNNTPAYKFDGGGNFQLWQPGDAGYNPNNLYRNSQATYFLPSVDEWYKAAYYDSTRSVYYDYPTGFDTAPTAVASGTTADTAVYNGQSGPADITLAGGLSPYGTMGQGGNVFEWEETDHDLVNDSTSSVRANRGGIYDGPFQGLSSSERGGILPSTSHNAVGFRVASIPEPATLAGDYNGNSVVDAADYTVWRDHFGEVVEPCSFGDGNCNGFVGNLDYPIWKENFGRTLGAGSGELSGTTVPEPSTTALAFFAWFILCAFRRRP